AVVRDQLLIALRRLERPPHGDRVEAAGAVHAEPQSDHLQPALEVDEGPGGLVASGDEQADRVGAAVERGGGGAQRGSSASSLSAASGAGAVSSQRHSSSGSTPSIRGSTSSAIGLTPGPSASAWPASAWRHFTRVGMPPALTCRTSSASPSSARRAR